MSTSRLVKGSDILDEIANVSPDQILQRKLGLFADPEAEEFADIPKNKLPVFISKKQNEYDDIFAAFKYVKDEYEKSGGFRPSLKDITKFMSQNSIGEELAILSGHLLMTNGIPVVFEGPSGSGKTTIIDALRRVIYPCDIYSLEGASDTALTYDRERINDSKYVILGELNKLGSNTPTIKECFKNWGEGKAYKRIVTNAGTKRTETYIINPKVYISSIADESQQEFGMGVEFNSRGLNIRTNASQSQTEDILDFQADMYNGTGMMKEIDPVETCLYRWFIGELPSIGLKFGNDKDKYEYNIMIPGAKYISRLLPSFFNTVTRDNSKLLKGIVGITRFHHYDRMTFTNPQGFLTYIATPQDIFLAYLLFGKMVVDSAKQLSKEQEYILKYIKYNPKCERSHIRPFLRVFGVSMTDNVLDKTLTDLVNLGYVDDTKESNRKKYVTTELYEQVTNSPPNFVDCIEWMKEDVKNIIPDLYDEYVLRYCSDEKLLVKDPLSDNVYDMRVHDFGLAAHELRTNNALRKYLNETMGISDLDDDDPVTDLQVKKKEVHVNNTISNTSTSSAGGSMKEKYGSKSVTLRDFGSNAWD